MLKQNIPVGGTGADSRRVLEALTPITGAIAPAVNAEYIGQIYVDTVAKKIYISIATTSEVAANDWIEMAAAVVG